MPEPSLLVLLGMAASVFVGSLAQRATGMGFALLASPFLVLVLGPVEGILVINAAGLLASLIVLVQLWRDVDWPRAAVLVPMGVVGTIPGAIAVGLLPGGPLTVAVSAVVIIGLVATMMLRGRTLPSSAALAAGGGLASGFMNATAGVGGPGVVVYARATGWEHHHFVATAQLQGVVLGAAALAAKRALPSLAVAAGPPCCWRSAPGCSRAMRSLDASTGPRPCAPCSASPSQERSSRWRGAWSRPSDGPIAQAHPWSCRVTA